MHDSPPLARRDAIALRLDRGAAVSAPELAREFGVSDDAIRRDLRALAQEGRCRRVYGGALPLSPAGGSMTAREADGSGRKAALAAKATELVEPGQTLFLDTGSTVLALARRLPALPGLRVVTNSLAAAACLGSRPDLALFVLGGAVSPEVGGCVGPRALVELGRYRIDLCLLGACAVSAEEGLAGFDPDDVEMKRALIETSRATALMVTTEKLGTGAPFRIGAVDRLSHLVLEHDAPPALVAGLAGPVHHFAAPPAGS